jgi:hypothetical protein
MVDQKAAAGTCGSDLGGLYYSVVPPCGGVL